MARVLVVDDYLPGAKSLARLLELTGATVDVAGGFVEGLSLYAAGRYDLVVSDGDLGDGRGEELIASVREQEPAPRCILFSAGFQPEDAALLEEQGVADRVLVKDLEASKTILAEVEGLDA